MIFPHLEKEKYYWNQGLQRIAGIDEAGRGPMAGPVVAAAVIVRPELIESLKEAPEYKLVRDSKTVSLRQREQAYGFITEHFEWGIGWCDHLTVDRINILQASFLAMKKALSDLKHKAREDTDIILVDGRSPLPNISIRQENIIAGDRHVLSIAAASIIAKVARDRIMMDWHEKFPQYGFNRHRGYGTKFHFEMIKEYGLCEIHRKTFKIRN
jgi:ribonuclease HII